MELCRQEANKRIKEGPVILTIFFLHLMVGIFPTQGMIYLIWAGLIVFSLLKPSYAVVGWIMLLPLEQYVTRQVGFSPFIGHTLILFGGVLWDGLWIRNIRMGVQKNGTSLSIITGLLMVGGFIGYNSLDNIRGLISVGLLVGIFLAVVYHIRQGRMSLIIASVIGTSILGIATSIIGFENTWRIAIDGNVRVLSNALGLSMVFTLGILLGDRIIEKYSLQDQRKLKILAGGTTLLFALFLITTVSRGAILAVALSASGMIAIKLFSVKNKKESLKKGLYSLPFIGFFIFAVNLIEQHITDGHLGRRLNLEMFDNIRFEIWGAALGQLNSMEWLIGIGPDSFRQLAMHGGYDYYAHSVFVDMLVSFGIPGLLLLTGLLLLCLANHILNKNILALGTTAYLLISFSTHGSLNSKFFWLTFAIVYGSFYLDSIDFHNRMIHKVLQTRHPNS